MTSEHHTDVLICRQYKGYAFLARVADRCGECEDDHVDVLMDRPFAYAPYFPSSNGGTPGNPNAPIVNRLSGPRIFGDPQAVRGGKTSPYGPGVWTVDWQWASCTSSHAECAALFDRHGYQGTKTPPPTSGIDSCTLKPISQPSEWVAARQAGLVVTMKNRKQNSRNCCYVCPTIVGYHVTYFISTALT